MEESLQTTCVLSNGCKKQGSGKIEITRICLLDRSKTVPVLFLERTQSSRDKLTVAKLKGVCEHRGRFSCHWLLLHEVVLYSYIVGIVSEETGASHSNMASTSLLPYGGITYFITSFDYRN